MDGEWLSAVYPCVLARSHSRKRERETAATRQRHWDDEVVISMMVTHPEVARKILRSRFKGLFLPREIDKNTECSTASVGGCQ